MRPDSGFADSNHSHVALRSQGCRKLEEHGVQVHWGHISAGRGRDTGTGVHNHRTREFRDDLYEIKYQSAFGAESARDEASGPEPRIFQSIFFTKSFAPGRLGSVEAKGINLSGYSAPR